MEIQMGIKITAMKIEVSLPKKQILDIVGFAEVQFLDKDGEPIFKVRGYTIKVKTFKDKPTFTVNAPAYRSGFNYKTSFVVEEMPFWEKVKNGILNEFKEQTGDLNPEDYVVFNNQVDGDGTEKDGEKG